MRMLIILILAALLTACGDNSQPPTADYRPPTALMLAAQPVTDKSIHGVEILIDGDGTETVTFPSYCMGEARFDTTINRWHVAAISQEDLTGRTFVIFSNPTARYEIVSVVTEDNLH